jgi:cation diffusion facilitator CzcD-associated flavoprotein CzcO
MADTLDTVIIGAGFGGICAAIRLKQQGEHHFRVYDKAGGIGGTWYHNTYPGAACDIQSHLYCYSFEPNPNWSRKFSPQAEIRTYIEHCAEKYGVMPHLQLGMEMKSLVFDNGLWRVCFSDGSQVVAHHVILANGGLHVPAYPDIPGCDDFAGSSMHSAAWDHAADLPAHSQLDCAPQRPVLQQCAQTTFCPLALAQPPLSEVDFPAPGTAVVPTGAHQPGNPLAQNGAADGG